MSGALLTVRAVLRLPSLRRLVPAFLAFSIAEWASWIAVVVYAYSRGGPSEAGLVAGVIFVPSILVAPAASMFGDRWPRARVLTAAYAVVALAMGAAAVALAVAPPIVAYLMATLAATSITLVRPAHAALLPQVVRTPDELAVANAASGTVEGLGALIGPLVAGLLIGLAGPAAVYGAIAVLTLGSALLVLPLGLAARRLVVAAAVPRREGLLQELGAGLRAVVGDRRLFAVMAVLSGAIALLGAFNVFLTVIAIDLLGGDESTIGYVAAVAGLGSVARGRRDRLPDGPRTTGHGLRPGRRVVRRGGRPDRARARAGRHPRVRRGRRRRLGVRLRRGPHARAAPRRRRRHEPGLRRHGVDDDGVAVTRRPGRPDPHRARRGDARDRRQRAGARCRRGRRGADPHPCRSTRAEPGAPAPALRAVPMFGPLSAPVLERLATGATTVQVAAGEAIITAGEIGDRFYVILAGEVEVTTAAGGRRRQRAGDAFGEIALLRDIPRTATVTAIVPTELLALDRGPFLEALTGQPREPVAGGRGDRPAGSTPTSPSRCRRATPA